MASSFDGYVGLNKKGEVKIGKTSREDRARGASEAYGKDYEGMKTNYDTYHRKSDPSPSSMSSRLSSADERAGSALAKAGEAADSERERERRRGRDAGEIGKEWNETFK
jgi:hypothetical protein